MSQADQQVVFEVEDDNAFVVVHDDYCDDDVAEAINNNVDYLEVALHDPFDDDDVTGIKNENYNRDSVIHAVP